jgi:hypothetical protein
MSADGATGLAVAGSLNNIICCNSFDGTDFGLIFWGMCDGTRLRQSSIGSHRTGLRCQNGTVIGQQVHRQPLARQLFGFFCGASEE